MREEERFGFASRSKVFWITQEFMQRNTNIVQNKKIPYAVLKYSH